MNYDIVPPIINTHHNSTKFTDIPRPSFAQLKMSFPRRLPSAGRKIDYAYRWTEPRTNKLGWKISILWPIYANINDEGWALLLPRSISQSPEICLSGPDWLVAPWPTQLVCLFWNDRFDRTSGFGVVGEYLGWWKKFEPMRDRWLWLLNLFPLKPVPSGYPNPTRYPVFHSIPDPIQF